MNFVFFMQNRKDRRKKRVTHHGPIFPVFQCG